jgi:hypothetical protein
MKTEYRFSAKLWRLQEAGGWHFVSLPPKTSDEIRAVFKNEEQGWGRLKTTARIGSTAWQTAIWFDTQRGFYLLPVKADVRKKENMKINQTVAVTLLLG